MKQVFSVLSVTCVAFFTLFLSTTNVSCKKGDTGPKGDTGNANVQFSGWLNVQFAPAKNTAGDTVAWTATINAPKITKSILDSGTVKVYVNVGSATNASVFPLPITDYYALSGIENINLYFSEGKINLYATDDASTITQAGVTYWQFRYVIIPGGVKINGRAATNVNDYNTITDYYNIPK